MIRLVDLEDNTDLPFDAAARVSFGPGVLVTRHAIEPQGPGDAGVRTDASIRQPLDVTVEGDVTTTPVSGQGGINATGVGRITYAIEWLHDHVGRPLRLVHKFGVTDNLFVTRYPHDETALEGVTFNVGLTQVPFAIATNRILPARVVAPRPAPDVSGFEGKQDRGLQATDTGDTSDADVSFLSGLTGRGG